LDLRRVPAEKFHFPIDRDGDSPLDPDALSAGYPDRLNCDQYFSRHRGLLKIRHHARRAAKSSDFPLSWATILGWGGLRGGLSMVLALALPEAFVHREMILNTTFGVVLLTLLVQGLTIKPLVRALRLVRPGDESDRATLS
jgi:hypothetical protein